jgi:hypothetical protein
MSVLPFVSNSTSPVFFLATLNEKGFAIYLKTRFAEEALIVDLERGNTSSGTS